VDLVGIEPTTSSMPFQIVKVNRCIYKALVAPKGPQNSPRTAYCSQIVPTLPLSVPTCQTRTIRGSDNRQRTIRLFAFT
jgi:hypothetical protein